MLNIQHFTKTYGEKRAVDDLSLHIAPVRTGAAFPFSGALYPPAACGGNRFLTF